MTIINCSTILLAQLFTTLLYSLAIYFIYLPDDLIPDVLPMNALTIDAVKCALNEKCVCFLMQDLTIMTIKHLQKAIRVLILKCIRSELTDIFFLENS